MIVVFTITLLTMSTTPTMVSPPSPGVIPAGIANLVQLTYLRLDSTTVSGTCGCSAAYGWSKRVIFSILFSTLDSN